MAEEKIYQVKKKQFVGFVIPLETILEGTLNHLKSGVFVYTLECGANRNPKINRNPKSINALIKAVNMSYDEIEGGYTRSYVELID